VTAYDSQGRMIGKSVPVVNGRYSLVLDEPGYNGLILLAVRDSTPGVADNFPDEATLRIADLGTTVLRSVVQAEGGNQTINITALTELAALKAGLVAGQTNLGAAGQIAAPTVAAANAAVSALFMVNISSGDVLTTTITDANGAAAINPAFARSSSTSARNYGIALKAIANLQLTDPTRYPDQGVAIQKLADGLKFSDTQPNKLKWRDATTQSDLFNERIASRANDSSLPPEQRQQARALLDLLQKLPDGGSVNDYLLQNHVALPEPILLTKNATPGASPWQAPASDGRLVLDQGDLASGGLAVKAPPQARVEVTLVGHDARGSELIVTLPASIADSSGIAVLRPNQAALDLLSQMTREQPVTARVTVSDGDNNRANQDVWKGNADVRIDVNTPPGLTDFANSKIVLVNDTFYNGGDGNDPLRTTPLGNEDQITSDAAVRVLLTRALKPEERLEFKVATSAGADNAPRYGEWFNPADLRIDATDSNGQVRYVARNLATSEGPVWIKARILLTAAQSGASQGSARELETPLRLTLDKTAPTPVQLVMSENRDDGMSSEDGISSQTGVILMPRAPFETNAEVHLRLLGGSGTDGTTLLLLRANGDRLALTPDSWIRWQSGDQLQLAGQTLQGNGKARLQVRQIDAAGNFTDSIQTFISDSTRVIEQVVLLAGREKAFNEAKAAVAIAQEAHDQAAAADKPARQTILAAAQTALQQAQAARDQAPEQVRLGLLKSDGSTRLSDLMGKTIDPAFLPAILRAVAATGDPEQVNDGPGLKALVNDVVTAATAALLKASVYGDNDTNPAASLERSMDITLVSSTTAGTTARATLVLDTLAPVLDLDANKAGIQAQSNKSVTQADAASGVKLFSGEMAAPIADDIAFVRLTLPGGSEASGNQLILGKERFATSNNIDFNGSLGDVSGLELHYVAATRVATISRTGGAPLDGVQVKAIMEALKYSFVPPATEHSIGIELMDQASNVARGDVALSLDTSVPARLNTTVVTETQKAYGVAKMANVFGIASMPATNPHNLGRGEEVALQSLPSSFDSAASFLAAIRGISAEWGGTAITDNANTSNPNIKSYNLFSQPLNPRQELAVLGQGPDSNVLGTWLSFGLVRQAGKSADNISLSHLGSFELNHLDLYQSEPLLDKSRFGIDLANIGLLYQIDAHRPSTTPTIQVNYDGSRAAVGDVVALFEGNTMLARKVLTRSEIGGGNKTVNLTVAQSLEAGEHDILARYTDLAGNIVNGAAHLVSVPGGSNPVTLSNLSVRSSKQAPTAAQALNGSEDHYAVVNDIDTSRASGHSVGGPVFSGKVGGGRDSDRYVVTVEIGGKVLAFDEVAAGDFSISLPAGLMAPDLYRDVTITASRSEGNALGQSTAVQGLKLGWYWAAQLTGDIAGSNGNDDILLGATRNGAASFIQTGAGQDKVIVGSFDRTDNLAATVGDFVLGVDKIEVFNQTLTLANLSRFVTASAGANPNDTRLMIDLDGAGPSTLTYALTLQNVVYNSANTATLFGV